MALTQKVIHEISRRIDTEVYKADTLLPPQDALAREFGVSRTVVREAIASLRMQGRVSPRQGVGVFVTPAGSVEIGFSLGTPTNIRSTIEILEFRLAVESEAVQLAALRRSPSAMANIVAAFDSFERVNGFDPQAAAAADFAFHLAIAEATENRRFVDFLNAVNEGVLSDLGNKYAGIAQTSDREAYAKRIVREHGEILSAIVRSDPDQARDALRAHLGVMLKRYRALLNS